MYQSAYSKVLATFFARSYDGGGRKQEGGRESHGTGTATPQRESAPFGQNTAHSAQFLYILTSSLHPSPVSTCWLVTPVPAEHRVALAARQLRVGVALPGHLSPLSARIDCNVPLACIYEDADPDGTELRTLVPYELS
ncbi:hypothetical protein K438DRAFT_1776763 [Mycena galopus ATCC 62051]|nr:hypothetical protein K438DRAFT_1776763 [Mycena galopus ATCC 62051]